MILTELTQFKAQRKKADSKYIRIYKGVEINISAKKVQVQCDEHDCNCTWQGNLIDFFDKDFHECRSCRVKGDKSPKGMKGKTPWNKGLTKQDDDRIKLKGIRHSAAISGANNPNFGLKGSLHPNFGKSLNSGSANPAYKDGKSYERWTARHDLEQRQWAKRVKERGNYTCQVCSQKGGKLVSHHLFSYSVYPDLKNEDSNGICLCVKCHNEFHQWNGGAVKPCTSESFFEWRN
jgi:hypothetical protein